MTGPSTQKALPEALPADNTPNTYSGNDWHLYLVDAEADAIREPATVTTTAAAATGATTLAVAALNAPIADNAVLDFGGVDVTVTEPAAAGATQLTVAALTGPLAQNARATTDGTLTEVPLGEQFNPDMPSSEETIQVHGRTTPIRVVNGKDLTMTVRTVAGITDPVVQRLKNLGRRLSPNNKVRIVLKTADGYAILATVNVAGKPTAAPSQSQRWEFTMNLSGDMYDADLNDANPTWTPIGR
ncbi:hypothetical protein [Deinococcus sp. NW-56]|uniref:hypothetical protein n=1 Tax=Deinococcus sp. NW-56 TaxID=2080419 RepID=UPI000CF47791|nr:hypothetical protein [Deinococcus sp. NW-56]